MWFHGTYLRTNSSPASRSRSTASSKARARGNAVGAIPGSTRFKMIQPTFEILPDAGATGEDAEFIMLEMGRIVPVYESLGGKTPWGAKLTSRWLRRVMWTVFRDLTKLAAQRRETLPRVAPSPRAARAHERARSACTSPSRNTDDGVDVGAYARAQAAHLRGVLVPRTRPRTQAPTSARARRDRLRRRTRKSAPRSSRCCRSSRPRRRSVSWARSSPTCARRVRCAVCCRAMSAAARRSSRSRPRWWPSRTAIRPR